MQTTRHGLSNKNKIWNKTRLGLAKRLPIVSIQSLCHFSIILVVLSLRPCLANYHYKLHSAHSLGKNAIVRFFSNLLFFFLKIVYFLSFFLRIKFRLLTGKLLYIHNYFTNRLMCNMAALGPSEGSHNVWIWALLITWVSVNLGSYLSASSRISSLFCLLSSRRRSKSSIVRL